MRAVKQKAIVMLLLKRSVHWQDKKCAPQKARWQGQCPKALQITLLFYYGVLCLDVLHGLRHLSLMDLPFLLREGTELKKEMHLRMLAGGLWEGRRGSDTQNELRESRNPSTLTAVSMTSPTCPPAPPHGCPATLPSSSNSVLSKVGFFSLKSQISTILPQ